METKKYIFKIPFVLNKHSGIKIKEDDELKFILEPYTVYIHLFEDEQNGYFEIPFNDENKIYEFYQIFKSTLNRLNIIENKKYGSWSIKLENITEENLNNFIHETNTTKIVVDEENYKEIHTSFNLKIDLQVDYVLSIILTAIIDDITILYNDSKNSEIINDNKINTALDIYSNSFFQKDKPRYLSYFNILELLKPTIERDEETLTCVEKIIEYADNYKETFALENNELLKKDFDSLKSSIGNLKNKSFTPSILQLVNDYNISIEGYDDLEGWISSAYTVRNKIAHEGEILDNFDECLSFLEKFIPTLLLVKIKKRLTHNFCV